MELDSNQHAAGVTGLRAWSGDDLLDQIDIAIFAVDGEGLCQRFNAAAERLFGYSQADVLGLDMHALLHSKRADGSPFPKEECVLLRSVQTGESRNSLREVMWTRLGEAIPVECTVARIQMAGRAGAVVTAKDLRPQNRAEATLRSVQVETEELLRQRDAAARVEREQAEAESAWQRSMTLQVERTATNKLREQQELLQHLVQAAPVGVAVLDEGLRFRWHNHAFRSMMPESPQENLAGQSFIETVRATPELEAIVRAVQETGTAYLGVAFPYEGLPNGRRYWNWSLTRLPSHDFLVTLMDVTAQTMAQQALVQSDRMAAVGRLAASISHEINNPLEAVTNLLYLVHSDENLSETSREYVAMAETELSRVSQIASQTLRFHRHAPNPVARTPQQLVEPVLALYQGKLKHAKVHVTLDFDEALPVTTFEGDVRQILNNLIGNAIDAMLSGGDLRVKTRSRRCVRTGRLGMRITVTDTGHGMSQETAAHVFEPFYTTKGASGSGLGLWISHTLAERHGGKLQVKSRRSDNPQGRQSGTTFSLFLPSHEQPAQTATIQ